MAYRLNIQETLTTNVRRVVGEQIDRALNELSPKSVTPRTIHETRKCLKRIRAVLKLARPGFEKAQYKQENQRFREIAKLLSQTRDNDCLDEALSKLTATSEKPVRDAAKIVRRAIEKRRSDNSVLSARTAKKANNELREAARIYRILTINDTAPEVLQSGLQFCYRQARNARRIAYSDGLDDSFHEWRKPVQLHWRHMALFSEAWPNMFKARIEMARTLSQCLGDDHDLSILIAFVQSLAEDGDLTTGTQRLLERSAKARQRALRDIANPLGAMLFQESAKSHSSRIYGVWMASKEAANVTAKNRTKTEKQRQTRNPPATSNTS